MNISIFAAGAALLAGATTAYAQPTPAIDRPEREATSVRVLTHDSDFADATATRALYARLQSAAVAACDSGRDRDLAAMLADRACAREALSRAVATVDRPALTALQPGVAPTRLASR